MAAHGKNYRCTAKDCRKRISLIRNTFFSQSRLACNEVLAIGYYWLSGCNASSIITMTGHSSATISDYLGYYRSLVERAINPDGAIIGGEGIIVELDESKFGKRKYNRGHAVDGAWVIGGVERTEERLVFAATVEDRSASTLLDVISQHVRSGSIVYTDMWRGYSGIKDALAIQHFTVNHSIHFKDPETGVHTNTIEGTWNGIKLKIAPRNRTKATIDGHLMEFIWRRKHSNNLWTSLLDALRDVHYE